MNSRTDHQRLSERVKAHRTSRGGRRRRGRRGGRRLLGLEALESRHLLSAIPAGTLDTAFGSAGGLAPITLDGELASLAFALTMQNEKIIVAGTARTHATNEDAFSLARLNADGTIDTTFGSNGRVIDDVNTATDSIHDIAIRPSDGKILVAGYSRVPGVEGHEWDEGVLARYTVDGHRDADFGSHSGIAASLASGMTLSKARHHRLNALTLQSDGKIIVAGYVEWFFGGDIDFLVARFTEDGLLDNTFGNAGVVTTDFGDGGDDKANEILLQRDGKIVVVGTSHVGGSDDFAVARYTPDGRLDADFGYGGLNTIDFDGGPDQANTAVIQEREGVNTDRLIVGGSAWIEADKDFALACFTDEGFLDETFNSDEVKPGTQTENFHFESDEIIGIALQANGAIVAVGTSFHEGDSEWALARYTKDGDIDASFVGGGKRTFDVQERIRDFASSVAIQETDAKIVIAGYGVDPVSGGESWTVARLYGGAPDLFGLSVDVAPESLRAGSDFEVAFSVQNDGPLDAGLFGVGFYLSPDNTYSPDDFQYEGQDYFFREGEVGAGNTSDTARRSLSLPASGHSFWAGDGVYYVGIVVDSDSLEFVEEADEDNNHSVGEGRDVFGIQVRGTGQDAVRPTVSIDPPNLSEAGGAVYDFDVTYTDDVAVDVSTLDDSDLTVTGPDFFGPVRFVGVDSEIDGSPRMATYRIDAPGGTWNSEDNGTYAIEMRNDAVCDTGGNCVREGILDWFQVSISPPQQPSLTVSIIPETFPEAAGSDAATGTVTRDGPTTSAVMVTLESNDESEATVPATVVIAGGSTWATFPVTAVDDAELDGRQTVTVTASANGFTNGGAAVVVTDDEPATFTLRVASGDTEADSISRSPSISSDGRYIAFESSASNLVPGDTNGDGDVFVYDRQTGTVDRVSIASDGTEADDISRSPSISSDGRYVAFESDASNLVQGDTNDSDDVFVYDRQANAIERVSVTSDGSEANGESGSPSISSNGRYVAFRSWASNLVPGDTNGEPDVFVYDRQVDEIERVSVAYDGTEADGSNYSPSISSDGRYVAFSSWASNLVPGLSRTAITEIFVYDRHTDGIELVSVAFDGSPGNWNSHKPSISPDGRYVVFSSDASDLVQGDNNSTTDIFVYDRNNETTERVSIATDGSETIQPSYSPSISSDGQHIAFESWAGNIIRGDTNGKSDIFVYHRETDTIERVSVASDGSEANGNSLRPSISSDGRYVAFESYASNLVPGDTNSIKDVFIAEIGDNQNVPNVPIALSASVASSSQINLSWQDNSNNESGFKIERKAGASGSWSQIAMPASGATTYQSTGLSANTSYYYRVRAYNSAGNSAYSNEVSATTNRPPDTTPPTATLSAANIASAGESTHSFTVRYSDNVAVDPSDIGGGDVSVTGPWASALAVQYISRTSDSDTTPVTATYRINAPGGNWDESDNGTYTVWMNSSEVRDTSGNVVNAGSLGSFQVNIGFSITQNLVVSPTTLSVPEGGAGEFTVKLAAQPVADVTVEISAQPGSDPDLIAAPTALTFTSENWNVAQTVDVSAREDDDVTSGTASFVTSSPELSSVTVAVDEEDNDAPRQVVISVPDFARGPGQPVNVPAATGTGIPLSISDGAGVEHVFVELRYDPALLEITNVAPGPDAPKGSTVFPNLETPGVAIISFTTTQTPLDSGPANFATLEANVPVTATYRSNQTLDIVEARVNGQVPAGADDGTHVVAYLGDTSADGMYTELDARNVLMYEVALKDDFPAYGGVHPGIIGDVLGDGKADGLDAVRILQEIVGRDRPEIPPLPDPLPDGLPLTSPGPDPKVFMPTDLRGLPGDAVTVPILFKRLPEEAGTDFQLVSLGLRVRYPNELLTIGNEDVTRGTIPSDWLFVPNVIEDVEPGINEIRVSAISVDGANPDDGTLAELQFQINAEAVGTAALDLRATGTVLSNDLGEMLVLTPPPEDGSDSVDGLITIVTNQPPVADAGGPYTVAEGGSVQLDGSGTDPANAPLTFEWDLEYDVTTFNVDATGATPTFDAGSIDGDHVQTIALRVRNDKDAVSPIDTATVTITNVAPTIATSGDASVAEGTRYELTLGAITDPGADTVTEWIVDWGDGSAIETFTSGGVKTHTYADGDTDATITVDLVDEDGRHQDAGTLGISVNNVAPTVNTDSGSITVNEGATAANTGSYSDSGVDTVSLSTSIGSITDNGNGTWTWSFGTSDGPDDSQTVTITASDDELASSQTDFELTVSNVAPQAVDDYYAFDGIGVFEVSEAHGVLANDSDPGADQYTVDAVSVPAIDSAYGTVDINPDGSFSYTPPHEGFSARVDFAYEVTDDDGTSSEATATIDVGINGVIEGYVYADQNNSTGFDASRDVGLPSVRVTLISTDPPVEEEATTDRNGRYRFENLPAGTYRVIVNTPDKCTDDGEHEIAVELGINEVKDGQNLAEGWLRPRYMSISMLLASSPSWQEMLQQTLGAAVEEGESNRDFAYDIGEGEMVGTVSPEPITTFQATTAVEAVPAGPVLSESHPSPPVSTADMRSVSVDAHQVSATAVPVGSNVVGQNDALLFDDGNLGEPQQVDLNVVRLIRRENALPTSLELGVTFNVQPAMIDRWRNALIVFDYKSPTDFKFAGAFVGIDNWAIGRMTERGYVFDQLVRHKIDFDTDYRLRLVLDGGDFVLKLDDRPVISYSYHEPSTDGEMGLLSYEDGAEFKDLEVRRI